MNFSKSSHKESAECNGDLYQSSKSKELSTPSGPFLLGDFRLEILVDDSYLKIEGENINTSKFYAVALTQDDIIRITTNLFSTPSDVYDLIQYAKIGEDPKSSIEIAEDGKLTISQTTLIGVREKKIYFVIELQEQDLNPLQVCEKYLQKLPKEQLSAFEDQLVKIIEKVIEHSNEANDKLDEINGQISELEKKIKDRSK